MSSSYLSLLIMAAAAILAAVLAITNHNRELKRTFLKQAEKSWGNRDATQTFSAEAYADIRTFSDTIPADDNRHTIDDITWNDLDFDRIYQKADRCLSSPGDDVLYAWFRHPLLQISELKKRNMLIEWVNSHKELRIQMMEALFEIGRSPKYSYYSSAQKLQDAKPIGSAKYTAFSILTLFLIIMLFVYPVPAVILLMIDLLFNIYLEMSRQREIRMHLNSISSISRMLHGAEKISRISDPELREFFGELDSICSELKSFQRYAFFVSSKGSVNTGFSGLIMEYLNLLFHLDLIAYDRLLNSIQGQGQKITRLTELLGTVDASIAAASFRNALPEWCHLEHSSDDPALHAVDVYHPLLQHPCANSITADGGNLITGANASGKSTFLKSLAIGMILGQSIDTVPAKSWNAPLFRIYTSMALSDNISDGESYFVVEIRSLKRIMDAADSSEAPVFGVVDEVLRGTNTIERIAASAQLLTACVQNGSLIFAATHDIELTDLLAGSFHNYHFSGTIENGDVRFDYRLKNGPTTERNAIRLLKAAGYSAELAERAEASAEHFEQTGEWTL